MTRAVGCAVHSGWAAAVVLEGPPARLGERVRIVLADDDFARFAYHDAVQRPRGAAARIEQVKRRALDLATAALRALDGVTIVALPPPKPSLPALEKILQSHPLLHAAEGALFRNAIEEASRALGLALAFVEDGALPALAPPGPPWGKDQKLAASLAWAALQSPVRSSTKKDGRSRVRD